MADTCTPLPLPYISKSPKRRSVSASPHLQAIADVFMNRSRTTSPATTHARKLSHSRPATSSPLAFDHKQLAHQIAAETLLSIAPPSDKETSHSPDKTSPTLPPISSLDVPDADDARGTKRKLASPEPLRQQRQFSRSPRPAEAYPAPRPSLPLAPSNTASRYSIYGPTARDIPNPAQGWSPRYNAPGRPQASPAGREAEFFARNQEARISRRELSEHREQLREGRRWLEAMLAKTHQHLAAVEDLLAQPPPGEDDWEARDRQRAREIERLESERERERRLRYGHEEERTVRRISPASPKRAVPAAQWEGEAVVGSVALPRRQQAPSNGGPRQVWPFENRP